MATPDDRDRIPASAEPRDWPLPAPPGSAICDDRIPPWRGEPLEGRRLLVDTTGVDQLWSRVQARWERTLRNYPNRSASADRFSTPDGLVSLADQIRDDDLIHLHSIAGLVDIREMPKLFAGKRLVWTLHDMNPLTGGCHYSQGCTRYQSRCHDCPQLGPGEDETLDLAGAIWDLKDRSYRQLDLTIVTASRWLGECSRASALLGRFPHHVIPPGLDMDVHASLNRAMARQQLGLPQEGLVILFGARNLDSYRKGFSHFLRSTAYLKHLYPNPPRDIRLLVFGQDDSLGDIPAPYPLQRLGFLGETNRLRAAYSAADVFVVATREGNLPISALESLACGTPVVAFDIGGLPDLILHQQTGYLARFPDAQDMALGIRWALEQASEALRHRCRDHVINKYALTRETEDYRALYASLTTGRD
ncbi:glycosyltransferase [Thiocystis violacea]|uniref:glycosyltransferase n=1 Tax=Thiocystis violacea TaxID=13725 RepID=UPI001905F1E8